MTKFVCAVALAMALSAKVCAVTTADLRDYAIASCLIKQTASHDLQTEGYHLADIVINRAAIDSFAWKPLQNAVDTALAKRGMLMIHIDGPVAQATQPAPLASCLLVIDTPAVQRVMTVLARRRR